MPDASPSHVGLAAIAHLERAAADLEATGSEHGAWVANRIRAYVTDRAATLDDVFGLTVGPGGTTWRECRLHDMRNRLIRELAATITAPTITARIALLQNMLRTYASTSWIRDRSTGTPTAKNRLLFEIFTLDDNSPTGASRLREIIEG
jgi:hypothetical protein